MLYDHVIYHGGCTDGYTAAWLLHHSEPAAGIDAGRYGEPPPAELEGHVVIADFSYPRLELLELAATPGVERVTILDHHQTALEHLVDLPKNVEATFDLEHSGAWLTWRWLADRGRLVPTGAEGLANYVEDRDLWRFKLPASREIAAVIMATPMTWLEWDALAGELKSSRSQVIAAGRAVLRRDDVLIEQILGTVRPFLLACPDGELEVPTVASPYGLGSSVAGRLAEENPGGIGAYYIDYEDRREFGLRSRGDDGPDVARIAEGYGGGGHKHASGFRIARLEMDYRKAALLE